MSSNSPTIQANRRQSRRGKVARVGAAALGSLVLLGVGVGAANADDTGGIGIGVNIAELPAGALSLTVDPDAQVELTESGSTGTERQFVGELPEVTIADTRNDAAMPASHYWYVTAELGDFLGDDGQPHISPAGSFDWTPKLTSGDDEHVVAGGSTNDGSGDFGRGELLVAALDSAEAAEAGDGTWTASADLTFRTPVTVEPGHYFSTMMLSLFEEQY